MLRIAFAVLLGSLFLAACAREPDLTSTTPVVVSTSDASAAAALISEYRAAKGLPRVTVDQNLNRAAEYQAREVAAAGSLSHGAFESRMASFGVKGSSAENLSAGARSVEDVIARWKRSPGHNENLLLPDGLRIGFARAEAGTRYGRYWALVISQ